VALLEAADLVGEPLAAEVVAHQANGAVPLEDAVEAGADRLETFVGDLRLHDESGLELPHGSSSRTGARGARAPGGPRPAGGPLDREPRVDPSPPGDGAQIDTTARGRGKWGGRVNP